MKPQPQEGLLRRVVAVLEPPVARARGRLVRSPRYLGGLSKALNACYDTARAVGGLRNAAVRVAGLPTREDQVRLHGTLVRLEGRVADMQDRLSRLEPPNG